MANKSKKYLFTSNTYASLYNFRKEVIQNYISEGVTVYLLAPLDKRYTDYFAGIGCICLSLKMNGKSKNPISELSTLLQYRKIYKKIKPDIIFHYTIKANIYGSIAAGLLKIPSAAFLTGLGSAFMGSRFSIKFALFLYRVSLSFSKKVIVLNNDDYLFIKENIPKLAHKLYLLPGEGISLDQYNPTTQPRSNDLTFLMIARAIKQKGIVEYVEAIRLLKSTNPNARFIFMGELGVENNSAVTQEELNSWINEGTFDYWEFSKDIQPYIEKADCIVLPSHREGLSISLLEALAMKRPIITTNVPGCKDIVQDGLNGYICETKNPKSLASAIQKMINLPQERRIAMGEFGRKQVEEYYSMDTIWHHYKLIENQIAIPQP